MVNVGLIWAQTTKGVIGANNRLPWRLPEDLRRFSEITKNQTVIMGRNTWLSLPEAYAPLPERQNIIITSQPLDVPSNVIVVSSVEEALAVTKTEWAWIIGGGQLYQSTIDLAERIEVTFIELPIITGDTFAPEIPELFKTENETPWMISRSGLRYCFTTYTK